MIARQRRVSDGFTILEILISIVVLVLGITGIVALFPRAIGSSKATVQDTYAASIAQSVTDAVKSGLRGARYAIDADNSYFIFSHDGVLDEEPTDPSNYQNTTDNMWQKDYCVLLPRPAVLVNNLSANEPIFVYPVPNQRTGTTGTYLGASMDQRAFGRLGAPTDNFAPAAYRTTVEDMPAVWVGRTYMLGRVRDTASSTTREVRPEFFNDDLVVSGLTSAELTSVDPYTHYSFAMALKRARLYTAGTVIVPNPPPPAVPTNLPNFTSSLFELRIMVYRHFDQTAADTLAPPFAGTLTGGSIPLPKGNAPVAEFVSMVAN